MGNPLINSGDSFPGDIELDITLGAGTFYEPSGINSYDYATGQTATPEPGDTSLAYLGYGTTVASAFTTGWQVTPGTFQNLTVTWTCPATDNGQPLDVMIVYHDVTQTTCMEQRPAERYHGAAGGSHRSDRRGRLHEPSQRELERQRDQRDGVPDRPVH